MKPYAFVPLNRKVNKKPFVHRDKLLQDRYHGKWIIRGTAVTPVGVGTGDLTMYKDQIVKSITTQNNIPVIPGSSLKGVVRSIAEAISYSCIKSPIIKIKDAKVEKNMPTKNQQPCTGEGDEVCPSCQMFGYVNRKKCGKSLISFTDLKLVGDAESHITLQRIPPLFGPLHNAKDYDFYLDDEDIFQRKFYKHGKPQNHEGEPHLMLIAGSTVIGEISYYNLSEEDLGLLGFSLGLGNHPFVLKLGYGKPAYFGSMSFELVEVVPYRSFGFQSRSHTKEDVFQFIDKYGVEDSFIKDQKHKIQELFNYEKNKANTWKINRYGKKGY